MKIALSTIGKFHTFDLARELYKHGLLQVLFTGYPMFKLREEQLPRELVSSFPWLHAPYMAFRQRRVLGARINRCWEYLDRAALDHYVSGHLPACNLFVALSGAGLRSGRMARALGARYVCDRGSTHIREQDELLRQEHARWDLAYDPIDPRVIALEEAEYAEADCITVPSHFAMRSFLARGVSPAKLRRLPYGVNLQRFHAISAPPPDRFDILFVGAMSLRKGVPYLLQAFQRLRMPHSSLTFAGVADRSLITALKRRGLWPENVAVLGHVPQADLRVLMSVSHVLVLPSIEEGLAMVQAQAMACGCPVIGSEHSGAEDLFEDGSEGYIVPIRSAEAIEERLRRLAERPELRAAMSEAALRRVKTIGGWSEYGNQAIQIYRSLLT